MPASLAYNIFLYANTAYSEHQKLEICRATCSRRTCSYQPFALRLHSVLEYL